MGSLHNLKKNSNKGTYQIERSEELIDLLRIIESNFAEGLKSLAFSSTHYKNSQEKFIALIADYFNKKYPALRVAIVTNELKHGLFGSFVDFSALVRKRLWNFSHNLFIIDWHNGNLDEYSAEEIVNNFDIILWDLPELKLISDKSEHLADSFERMDALYIVSLKTNKFDDESFKREIFRFYLDHGLDIRTILPWQLGQKKRSARSKVTKFFYDLFR